MVVGAGRGPLVRSAFNASVNVGRKIKMYVIEKNPNAIVTLAALKEEIWADKGNWCRSFISYIYRLFQMGEHLLDSLNHQLINMGNLFSALIYRHDDNFNGYAVL